MSDMLLYRLNDPDFPQAFTATVTAIAHAANAQIVGRRLSTLVDLLGCTGAVYSSFVRDDDLLETYRFVSAKCPAFCQMYSARRLYAVDQYLSYARLNGEPAMATQIPARSEGQKELNRIAHINGFVSNVIVPFHTPNGRSRMGLLYIGAEHDDYFNEQSFPLVKLYLRTLAAELGEWYGNFLRKELLHGAQLNAMDLSMLQMVHDGLGSKQIAQHFDVTVAAVDKRITRSVGKLGATSRRHAVAIAFDNNLIA